MIVVAEICGEEEKTSEKHNRSRSKMFSSERITIYKLNLIAWNVALCGANRTYEHRMGLNDRCPDAMCGEQFVSYPFHRDDVCWPDLGVDQKVMPMRQCKSGQKCNVKFLKNRPTLGT